MKKKFYDLTTPQKSIWYTEQFYNDSNINNIAGYLKINKNADLKALEKAFNNLVLKNDSFKTKIILENSSPKQYFDDFIYENIEIIDLKDNLQLAEFEESFPMQHIDVLNNYLFLPKILRFPNGSGILALITHHLISDAWTMSLTLEEIYQNYLDIINNKKIDLTPNPSYIDFIESQNNYIHSLKYEKDIEFWHDQFESLPNIVSFKGNTAVSINANRKIYNFSNSLINKINEFTEKYNISDYIFFLSIYNIYFKNIFNTNNYVIGNPILNRSNYKEKHMAGMFVSIMPFIVKIPQSISFLDLCNKMAKDQKNMYRHVRFPYHDILDFIRKKHDLSDALYDIILSYQNSTTPSFCKWLHNHSQAESLQIHFKNIANEKNNLSVLYDYLTDIFSEKDIELIHERILELINQVLINPEKNINTFEIISKSDRKILSQFNKTKSNYEKKSNIVEKFEQIAKKYPKNIAVIDKSHSYTYQELNTKANYLAKYILSQNVHTDIIAFALKRSIDIVVAILAILKSGHIYMPIDPEYPSERINYMLENSKTNLLITNEEFTKNNNYNKQCIFFEKLEFNKNTKNLKIKIPFDKHCYIMYTSGSTGTPKAVTINHYNVLNFVQSMQQRLDYKPSQNNKVLSVTTVCFDIFVFELFPTLLSGLTLVIADELESKSPELLSNIIKEHKISKILTTPSRIELLFSDNKSYLDSLVSVKEFLLGGEPLPNTLLSNLQNHTNAKIYNLYGPTETTVYSTFKDVTDTNYITVGKPINNTQIYILNDYNHLNPIGQVGEICIGGDGVGSGYYQDDEKTNSAFIQNPYGKNTIYKTGDLGYWNKDGELICLGRKDHQIKIRGYRIELDDISNNIIKFNGIEKCVVLDKADKEGKKYLCAYMVCNKKIELSKLKKFLVDLLPHYMIPTYFMIIDKIPLTLSHKVDRSALPEPVTSLTTGIYNYVKPETKIEKQLVKTFKECLSISRIGIDTDIFDFNIDSLDIIRIQTKMLEYNYNLNTQDFYQYRTIRNLASHIEHREAEQINEIDEHYLINVNNSFNKYPSVMQYIRKKYKNILLLGCTGYLGMHILYELLTNYTCNITCIIRNKDNLTPIERLSNLYNFYFNKLLPKERITIIDADITKNNLGLDIKDFKELANKVDLVINSAANVRYYGEYTKFKKINVDVVQNLVNFCMKGNSKLIHISTLGVSGNYLVNNQKNYCSFDENDFYIGQQYTENVYIKTKFEAEKLIYEKVQEGLNASIFRIGNLTGRHLDGVFQQNFKDNAFYNIIIMILKFGILPNTIINEFLEFTPVDCCVDAILKLIFNVETNKYVFHLFNENYIQVSDILKIFKALGFETLILSGNDFKQKIVSLSNKNESILKGIVNSLDDTLGLSLSATVIQKNSYTNSCLEKLDFKWPLIDEEYIKKIVDYLNKKNYLS